MKREEFWRLVYEKEKTQRKALQKKCRMLNAQVRNLEAIIDGKK